MEYNVKKASNSKNLQQMSILPEDKVEVLDTVTDNDSNVQHTPVPNYCAKDCSRKEDNKAGEEDVSLDNSSCLEKTLNEIGSGELESGTARPSTNRPAGQVGHREHGCSLLSDPIGERASGTPDQVDHREHGVLLHPLGPLGVNTILGDITFWARDFTKVAGACMKGLAITPGISGTRDSLASVTVKPCISKNDEPHPIVVSGMVKEFEKLSIEEEGDVEPKVYEYLKEDFSQGIVRRDSSGCMLHILQSCMHQIVGKCLDVPVIDESAINNALATDPELIEMMKWLNEKKDGSGELESGTARPSTNRPAGQVGHREHGSGELESGTARPSTNRPAGQVGHREHESRKKGARKESEGRGGKAEVGAGGSTAEGGRGEGRGEEDSDTSD